MANLHGGRDTKRGGHALSASSSDDSSWEMEDRTPKKLFEDIDNDSSWEMEDHSPKKLFKDFGGINRVIDQLNADVIVPLLHPHASGCLGVKPVTGILLHGPPGCGKSMLAQAIANEAGLPFYRVAATDLVAPGCLNSGVSEAEKEEFFSEAHLMVPFVVFIDDIDAIGSRRLNCSFVPRLIKCINGSQHGTINIDGTHNEHDYVLVIGATNRPDVVDPALRRLFDREIALTAPDESARVEILSTMMSNVKVEGAVDLLRLAKSTPDFVGADLQAVVKEAGNLAWKKVLAKRKAELSKKKDWRTVRWSDEDTNKLFVTMADFEEAVKMTQPSCKREWFFEIPNVKWDDIGGLHSLRKEFDRYIIRRIKYPEFYKGLGFDMPRGLLLYGPCGSGMTLIAKAIANEAGANFIHIKAPEILKKHVSEIELAFQTIFSRARTFSPCIIFFDEVDTLTKKHGSDEELVIVQQVLKQLLKELDGIDDRKGVHVIGATKRPEVMDPVVFQRERIGKVIFVPLPRPNERGMILKALGRGKAIDANVDLMALGNDDSCEDFSRADLCALMHEAVMECFDDGEKLASPPAQATIKEVHFKRALGNISPSVSPEQNKHYRMLSKRLEATCEISNSYVTG